MRTVRIPSSSRSAWSRAKRAGRRRRSAARRRRPRSRRRRRERAGEMTKSLLCGALCAGLIGAAEAAGAGRSTILVERYGFLGGAGTAAGLANFCGLHAKVDGEHRQVVHGIADEVLTRLQAIGALSTPHMLFGGRIQAQAYDVSAYKLAAD